MQKLQFLELLYLYLLLKNTIRIIIIVKLKKNILQFKLTKKKIKWLKNNDQCV